MYKTKLIKIKAKPLLNFSEQRCVKITSDVPNFSHLYGFSFLDSNIESSHLHIFL